MAKFTSWSPAKQGVAVTVVIAVAVVAIVTGVLINNYEKTHSVSYKDGYVSGEAIIDGNYASNSASDDCNAAWPTAQNNPGDNETQWIAGCVAGWNAAEHVSNNPAAVGNSANGGNSG